MKKLLYSLFLLLFFIALDAQIVNIPDPEFKAALVNANSSNNIAFDQAGGAIMVDINNDGEIQISEALLVYKIQYIKNKQRNSHFILTCCPHPFTTVECCSRLAQAQCLFLMIAVCYSIFGLRGLLSLVRKRCNYL